MKILGTGLSGLVGSRVVELLSDAYVFENLSLETGVDITDKSSVDTYFSHSDAPWVFHMAAYTDVQKAESERALGEESVAWKVNVLATEHIVENCKKFQKKLLYVDTDYAFDGTKHGYSEEDTPHPLGWYAMTKYEGTKRVCSLSGDGLVIRISNPFRAHPVGKKDFVHKMLERMQSGQPVTAPKDQTFTPTFIDDIAVAIDALVKNQAHGVYHVASPLALSPYEAARTLADVYGFDTSLVSSVAFASMFQGRAPVPQHAALLTHKIQHLGVRLHSFAQGIASVKEQEGLS